MHADLLNTQEVHDMLASGWRTSEVFKLRLQRVWKCVRMPSIRKVRVCILHQYTEDPPAWLTCWDDERGSRGPRRSCARMDRRGLQPEAISALTIVGLLAARKN